MKRLRLDSFCHRQWNADYSGGTKMTGVSMSEFLSRCNEEYLGGKVQLLQGYAPFCKHLMVANWVPEIVSPTVALNQEMQNAVRTEYRARREGELPVLTRWLPRGAVEQTQAKYLDVILYSREQIIEETKATGEEHPEVYADDYEWAIISIKAQDVDTELPMLPITMMRNGLGKAEGGSGVPIDPTKYAESVEYWSRNITVE